MTERTVIVQTADEHNAHGRRYPSAELERQIPLLERRIEKTGAIYGELGHPRQEPGMSSEQFYSRIIEVRLDKVSHAMTGFRMEGKHLVCKVRPSGPLGKLVEPHFDTMEFAIRGLCDQAPDGTVTNLTLITIDAVAKRA